jgi:hypothetical protein
VSYHAWKQMGFKVEYRDQVRPSYYVPGALLSVSVRLYLGVITV